MDDESIASTNEDSMASASEESSATQRPSRRCKTLAMKGLIGNKKKQNEAETLVAYNYVLFFFDSSIFNHF